MDVLIPTIRNREEIKTQIQEIESTTKDANIIVSGFRVSASTNRNYCLNRSDSEIVIMMDDDMTGFFEGWAEKLIEPLDDPRVVMVSARLIDKQCKPGTMVGGNYDMKAKHVVVNERQLPTACIAFRRSNIRFNEGFIGSGFEDNRFCHVMGMVEPAGRFVINNDVKLVHMNEQKNQGGHIWDFNKKHYLSIAGNIVRSGSHAI